MQESKDDQKSTIFGAKVDLGTLTGSPWISKSGSSIMPRRVQTQPWEPTAYHDDHKYEAWLHDWTQLSNLQQELGDSFEVLAPTMYNRWKECKAIIDFRKANDLLGG